MATEDKNTANNLETMPQETKENTMPVVVIRDVIMFPDMSLPLSVDREKSINAIDLALAGSKNIIAVTQTDPFRDDPEEGQIYKFGVMCEITQSLKLPDGSIKVFLMGNSRAKLKRLYFDKKRFSWFADAEIVPADKDDASETVALMRSCLDLFEKYAKLSRRIPVEGVSILRQTSDPNRLADTIATNIMIKNEHRQELLETVSAKKRLERLLEILTAENEILEVEEKIHSRVRSSIDKSQKEYYLNEQMKAIQKELRQKDDFQKEIDELKQQINGKELSKEAKESALKELARLEKMAPFSPEATVSRTYLDWLVKLPWGKFSKDILDIKRAKEVLDADHFGLKKPKERVLEYLAVAKLTKELRGPILCFIGPPGVGKTSFAKSIARAMGRKFVRMALGGVRDESEIRGHRRTYIGSMPGRIIQNLTKAKTSNPVFLLDEIDKMGMDWRGDPAAALLEVLDPEQNRDFSDHYLDITYDISKVMFITTANSLESIPQTLRDRLETIEFHGYTHNEKMTISRDYLIPRQLKEHGLEKENVEITGEAVLAAIRQYTREAGVRNLEREIGSISRKSARELVETGKKIKVTKENINKYLGIPKYIDAAPEENAVGVSTGLAWTSAGGEILSIEVLKTPGKGNVVMTGTLGNVMQESAKAALSFVKSIKPKFAFAKTDFHIHVPEGATPKDGPSAGTALATALASLVMHKPVRRSLAMTGEITLTGRVLPVGGIKEKLLAAHREGVKTVLIPKDNVKDLEDVPENVQKEIKIIPVKKLDEVFKMAFR